MYAAPLASKPSSARVARSLTVRVSPGANGTVESVINRYWSTPIIAEPHAEEPAATSRSVGRFVIGSRERQSIACTPYAGTVPVLVMVAFRMTRCFGFVPRASIEVSWTVTTGASTARAEGAAAAIGSSTAAIPVRVRRARRRAVALGLVTAPS